MKDGKKGFILIYIAILLISLAAPESGQACTLIVASGKATRNGRPLMWKNRDTSRLLNKLMYFSDARYKFIGLIDANDARGGGGLCRSE